MTGVVTGEIDHVDWDIWDIWDIDNILKLYLHKPVGREFLTVGTFGTFETLGI